MNSSSLNPKRRKNCFHHDCNPCCSSPEKCKCECSSKVEFEIPLLTFIAKICPHCNIQDSFVSWSSPAVLVFPARSFSSTCVNPPQCISTDTGTILNVTGFGTLIQGSQIAQVTFGLNLFKTFVGSDIVLFSAFGFDQNGATTGITFAEGVPNDDLMINSCNSCSCPLASSQATNAPLNLENIREKLNKLDKNREEINEGKMVIMTNGQVETINISDIQKQNETQKGKGFFSWFKN